MSDPSPSVGTGQVTSPVARYFLRRRDYEIWSPWALADVSSVLAAELGPEQVSPMGITRPSGERVDHVRSITIVSRDAKNGPWRFVLRGSMNPASDGTRISGVVGPRTSVLTLVMGWLGVVTLFLVSGLVSVVVGMASGQHPLIVPWVLVPGAIFVASFLLHQVAAASAEQRWRATDQWLRDLVHARDVP